MRVLHFFKTYWPDTFGGAERTIHAIAKGTAKYGVQSDVLSLSRTPKESTIQFDGHMAHKAKLDFEFASTGFSREVFGRFRDLSRRADIIHYHFPWPMMDVVDLAASSDTPTIVTYHSDIVKQKFLLRFYSPVMHRFLDRVNRIVATSPNYVATSEVLQRYKAKCIVIPLGLDEADYTPATEKEKAEWRAKLPRPFFLFVGVLRYYKGIDILLQAAAITDCDVVIVGEGPMELDLRKQAQALRLSNVHFLGALSDEAKTALLELCLAFIFPSNMRSEAFGLSLVEAAMFGKPMISCEIGTGTSFVNLNRKTGIVVPINNATALSNAMKFLCKNHEKAAYFGANARERFMAKFTADRMAADYVTAYKNIISN